MTLLKAFIAISLVAITVSAQKPDEVLATATGHTFKLVDLPAEIQKAAGQMPASILQTRTQFAHQILNERVLDAEAKARGMSTGKMVAAEKAKIADPTATQIQAVYDASKAQIGNASLESVRKQIVAYLRREPEQKMLGMWIGSLRTKYKASILKDVNTPDRAPTEIVLTAAGVPMTIKEFDALVLPHVHEARQELAEHLLVDLKDAIYSRLVTDEAKAAGLEPSALIAREVTNKLKDFSDQERHSLELALSERLFNKYQVRINYTGPAPLVQNISVDDDPSTGPATAPVTVIMFSDFQCSGCAATHPILKGVMTTYPADKLRFVVRDFPLESIHEHAFRAAMAANAARIQGKFFEMTEILYKRQDALDDASLRKYAAELGLNVKQFELDFNSEKNAEEIRKDMADGAAYGIGSTPSIFVNGIKVRTLSAAAFKAAIDRAMRK